MTRIGSKSYSRMKLIEIGDVGRFVGWVGGGRGSRHDLHERNEDF